MSIVKQVLLKRTQGSSLKCIARELGISKNTVKKYLQMADSSGKSLIELLQTEDEQLEQSWTSNTGKNREDRDELMALFPWMEQELRRPGVTQWLLWGEYRLKYPEGYSYSQFCWYYQQWRQWQNSSMVMDHAPGDKIYVDFAGKKMHYTDMATGRKVAVEILVGVLGYSQLCFAMACASQTVADFLHGCTQMLEYFGGAPSAIVTDNLKSSVVKTDRYEPTINEAFGQFCNHYGMAIIPTRVAKPKDKGLVENAVKIMYIRIYGALRNRTFYSLNELNQAILELLDKHNAMPFTQRPHNRRELFEQHEQALLTRLPKTPFELKYYRNLTVQKNSHIILTQDHHYYSVPFRYIGARIKLIYTSTQVSVYFKGTRIAWHYRDRSPYRYTTIKEHLPSHYQYMMGLHPDQFIKWGKEIGEEVGRFVELLIKNRKHPEQAYKSCQGLQALAREMGNDKLISACQQGLELKVYGYWFIKRVMQNNPPDHPLKGFRLPEHENIRGAQAYK